MIITCIKKFNGLIQIFGVPIANLLPSQPNNLTPNKPPEVWASRKPRRKLRVETDIENNSKPAQHFSHFSPLNRYKSKHADPSQQPQNQ